MIPLSEKLRPNKLNEMVGQDHLIGEKGQISRIIKSQKPLSILLVGPPGCGKTTLAKIYANSFDANFKTLSAIFSGINDLKNIINEINQTPLFHKKTILFVDEIHRFNKTQQDAFLPFVENGTIILVGATTENPSFSLNNALLSRLNVINLHPLNTNDLNKIINSFETKTGKQLLKQEEKDFIIKLSQGDGRHLINILENIQTFEGEINLKSLEHFLNKRVPLYDKNGENHFNLISALHKSIRGSDPQAAIYWLCRILHGGEDPLYIARRLIRIALEDIGLSDPNALNLAMNGFKTYQMLGSPEGELALAEVAIYLALCPKSNKTYEAFKKAKESAENSSYLQPPMHILNAPTNLMKKMGYSKGYIYDPDTENSFSGQDYLPNELKNSVFYTPVERGFERDLGKRMEYFKTLKSKIKNQPI